MDAVDATCPTPANQGTHRIPGRIDGGSDELPPSANRQARRNTCGIFKFVREESPEKELTALIERNEG
jgi:hypothetical protein